MSKQRHFFIRTYLCELQIKMVIMAHNVHHYAYILHDKDIKEDGELVEPHYHLILSLYNANSVSSVNRWFKGFTDSKGMLVQSHVEIARDRFNCFDYLTHETKECLERGDYVYPKSNIVCDNIGFYFANRESEYDTTTLCLMDLIKGVPYETMIYRYGKHFILNHDKFIDMACLMIRHEHFKPQEYGIYDYDMYKDSVVWFTEEHKKGG